MTRRSDLQFFEIVNLDGGVSGSHFQKIKPDGLVIRLCNFMKDSYEIKKLYGSAGKGYGVEEEFVPD